MGVVSPLGLTAAESWNNATAGKSGIAPITLFDTKDCPVTIAGEVKGFDPARVFSAVSPHPGEPVQTIAPAKDIRKLSRFIQLAMVAGLEAYIDSGIDAERTKIPAERIGINVGVGMGGLPEIEETRMTLHEKGYRRISPFYIPTVIPNMASGYLGILLNARGLNVASCSACATSGHSIGESFRHIQYGYADVMIAGGAEAVVSPTSIGGFAACRALSTRNAEPTRASRPYDEGRDGFVMGEGSAVLILEEYEFAKKRGARIYGEILGYAATSDAYHITSPSPEGEGGGRAMELALKDSGLSADRIDYVNSHGTSTPLGDAEEAKAIARLLASNKKNLHVSSTKSMTGHLLGAAGALEAFFSLCAIRDGIVPPTINLEKLDPECAALGLNFTPHEAIRKPIRTAMSNSFGFGGTNVSLIFGKI